MRSTDLRVFIYLHHSCTINSYFCLRQIAKKSLHLLINNFCRLNQQRNLFNWHLTKPLAAYYCYNMVKELKVTLLKINFMPVKKISTTLLYIK